MPHSGQEKQPPWIFLISRSDSLQLLSPLSVPTLSLRMSRKGGNSGSSLSRGELRLRSRGEKSEWLKPYSAQEEQD